MHDEKYIILHNTKTSSSDTRSKNIDASTIIVLQCTTLSHGFGGVVKVVIYCY